MGNYFVTKRDEGEKQDSEKQEARFYEAGYVFRYAQRPGRLIPNALRCSTLSSLRGKRVKLCK